MAQTVKLKRSNTAGTIPTTSNLALGEVAINTKDGKFFLRKHVDGSTGDAIHAYAPQGINAYGTQELVVKVVTKTTAHPNHGSGSSSGYTVQGLEGPFLALIPGNTYKFDVSDNSNSGHPFRFYLDAAKATAYTTGVTTSGSAGNSGAYVQIAVTTSTPQVLYYQCSAHSLMGSAAYVASDAIAANAVGTSQIAQNSITSSEIPDNSIGATQISAAVLAAKQDNLGNNSITAAMISQNTVGISELNVTDGSNGQVLTTNGSGTLSFANQSAGTVTETFKTISVSGQDDVVADGATDTLTLAAGSGMTITTNASNDTVTFVSSASGIADDAVTTSKIADLNVTAAKLANNSVTAAKIAANAVGISELNVSDGSNGQALVTDGSGTLSFSSISAGGNAFGTIAVSGQSNVAADSNSDTLTFVAGSNITLTTDASADSVTIASTASGGSSSSFAKNTFTGDGSDTTFTLTKSISNEDNLIVFIDGVYQADNVFSVSGTTLTFATAPADGRLIEVFQMEGGIIGTAPIIATMTGDGSDTTLALGTTPNSENATFVTIDGAVQHKSTYSVSGSTLTFSEAPPNGAAVECMTFTNQTTTSLEDGDGDTKIQVEESTDEDKIRFDTGGTERMIIDSTGVGIGTSSPASNLHVSATGEARLIVEGDSDNDSGEESALIEFKTDGGAVRHRIEALGSGGNDLKLTAGSANTTSTLSSQIIFETKAADASTAERMRIDSSGNVGIGMTPFTGQTGYSLQIGGTSQTFISIHNTTTGNTVNDGFSLGNDANNVYLTNRENTPMILSTNNTERMRIDASGNVGIGTSSPIRPLHVHGATSGDIVFAMTNNSTGATTTDGFNIVVAGPSGDVDLRNRESTKLRMYTANKLALDIDSAGNVNKYINQYTATSITMADISSVNGVGGTNNSGGLMLMKKDTGNNRSISAAGTLNASGNDYAEYMTKSDGCGDIAKGDVVGVDADGKLTKIFNDAVSFVIKSTEPSFVGGDAWLTENQSNPDHEDYINPKSEAYNTARASVDRIAFCGQVPVNITGSFNVGDYVYPQAKGTAIEAVAKSNPTFEEYQLCVGKIWATQEDGRPFVSVKIN